MAGDGALFRRATWHRRGHRSPDLSPNEHGILENALNNAATVKETVNAGPLAFVPYGLDPRCARAGKKCRLIPGWNALGVMILARSLCSACVDLAGKARLPSYNGRGPTKSRT